METQLRTNFFFRGVDSGLSPFLFYEVRQFCEGITSDYACQVEAPLRIHVSNQGPDSARQLKPEFRNSAIDLRSVTSII